MLTFDN